MFQDADPAGIAFFSRFFEWCHEAYEEMFRAAGLPLGEVVKGEIILPLASASADFKAPLAHGDAFTVVVKVAEIKEKAFVLEHDIIGAEGQLCARVKTVHVAVSKLGKKSVPLPENILVVLRSHQG